MQSFRGLFTPIRYAWLLASAEERAVLGLFEWFFGLRTGGRLLVTAGMFGLAAALFLSSGFLPSLIWFSMIAGGSALVMLVACIPSGRKSEWGDY